MNRGARRLPIFGDDNDRLAFLDRLGAAVLEGPVEMHAYALMANHFHLLVRSDVPGLATLMRRLGSSYTRRFNVKYGLDGALFRGRYRSAAIESEPHLSRALRYIHRNPSPRTRPSLSSLVWTSHLAYIGSAPRPEWLSTTLLERVFSGDIQRFRTFIEGDDPACGPIDSVVPPWPGPPSTVAAADVERAIGVESDPERALLLAGGRGVRNDLRVACAILCHDLTNLTAAEIADRYGFRSASAVRSTLQRGRSRIGSDPAFASIVNTARTRLRPAA